MEEIKYKFGTYLKYLLYKSYLKYSLHKDPKEIQSRDTKQMKVLYCIISNSIIIQAEWKSRVFGEATSNSCE